MTVPAIQNSNGQLIPVEELPEDICEELERRAIIAHYVDETRERIEAEQVQVSVQTTEWLNAQESERTGKSGPNLPPIPL